MSSEQDATDVAKAAKSAFEASQLFDAHERVKALQAIREELQRQQSEIVAANKRDLQVCLISPYYPVSDTLMRLLKLKLPKVDCQLRL